MHRVEPYVSQSGRHRARVSWDQVRYIYYRTMRPEHCVYPRWGVHPESQGRDYQGYLYSGLMSRISFHHRADGGCGGA
jgi:hypothetical protein